MENHNFYGDNNTPEKLTNLNSNENQKLELVYALFNPHLFQEAKNNIELLNYAFQTDYATKSNNLIQALLSSIKDYSLDSLDTPMISSILLRTGKTDSEAEAILRRINEWRNYPYDSLIPVRDELRGFMNNAIINRAWGMYSKDPTAFKEYLETHRITLTDSNQFSSITFDQLDVAEITAGLDYGQYITGVKWLDDTFAPEDSSRYGVPKGQMVMISCPPGTGKTMWMMGVAVGILSNRKNYDVNGRPPKIHYLAMGDMKKIDFVSRIGCIITGQDPNTVQTNIKHTMDTITATVGKNFEFSVLPAGKLTVDEYVETMAKSDFDVLMVDYDTNFKSNAANNMYHEYGVIYEALTSLTQMGKLVFIAAQPKQDAWVSGTDKMRDTIEMNMIGESARKIHTVDVAITCSKNEYGNSGIFKIIKNRRGESNDSVGYIRMPNGRFKYFEKELFQELKSVNTKKWTESQIDQTIYMFKQKNQQLGINNSAQSTSTPRPGIKNPFN